jgi:hypothetical protein
MSNTQWTRAAEFVYVTVAADVTYTVHAILPSTWRWHRKGPQIRWEERGDYHTKDEAIAAAEHAINNENDQGIPL